MLTWALGDRVEVAVDEQGVLGGATALQQGHHVLDVPEDKRRRGRRRRWGSKGRMGRRSRRIRETGGSGGAGGGGQGGVVGADLVE